MSRTQPARIKTPLAEDLLFHAMHGTEELGRPFVYELDLLSLKQDLPLDDVLGHASCVELDLPNGDTRYFHGYVTHFSQVGRHGGYAAYRAELRPWLWFLSRTQDCRIFQQQTVPDIIKEVFREHGFSDFKDSLSRSYPTLEYCVQYRESDLNFVSRLMEQEGIYYYFKHEEKKHTLVMTDSYGGHEKLAGYEEIPYFPPSSRTTREEHVYDWQLAKSVQPGKYVLRAYDFKKPKVGLETEDAVSHDHAQSQYEVYDYPGEYTQRADGDVYARVRMQELAAQHERMRGVGDARGIAAGGLFTLKEFPRADQNREYLVLASRQSVSLGEYESGGGEGLQYECGFEVMDSQVPYRAPRLTPKPAVQGPQTALVVGKSGEEIWTDEFGRVKVQFHWDRNGGRDENSSCWVRVAQVWAGAKWGGIQIPRIGQEVIVDFLEGDPDQPIITGRVYNADNMPPYSLPDNKTQSGLKSRSSKEGTPDNFNEIRFEDKKGKEELYIHAEKDQNVVVENNQTIVVGFSKKGKGDRVESVFHDRTLEVGNDKSETVGNNKTIKVGAAHSEVIGAGMSITVGSSLTESVAVNYAETVGGAMELTVGGAIAMTAGASLSETVGGSKSLSVGGSKTENIGGNQTISVGGNFTHSVDKDAKVEIAKNTAIAIGGQQKISVSKEHILNAKKIQLVAQDEISIKTGSAEILMKKNGDITIKGNKINVKGSGDVVIKGSKIKEN